MEIPLSRSTAPRRGLFTTFYSFKGGVGRTMALLNVAAILARLGRRVLMIDFDLEAPGLTLFQRRQQGEPADYQHPGLVDAFADFIDDPSGSSLGEDAPDRFFKTYVTTLDLPVSENLPSVEGGRLDLLPTGCLDGGYEGRLYGMSFSDLFESGVGLPLIRRLKAAIKDSDRYDYVFVDSRTGFSDEGSICTRYLADDLVVVTGLNHQNLEGTARFLRQSGLAGREGAPNRIGFVASPVPAFYEDKTAERKRKALDMITEAGFPDARFVAEVPYHPILALEEDPRLNDLSKTPLFEAYGDIQDVIQEWSGDSPEIRIGLALEMLESGEEAKALVLIRALRQEAPHMVLSLLSVLVGVMAVRQPANTVGVLRELLDLAREIGRPEDEVRVLNSLGFVHYAIDEYHDSLGYHERALAIARDVGDRNSESANLGNIGSVYFALGEVDKAIEQHSQALSMSREIGDRRGEASHLTNLGSDYLTLGELKRYFDHNSQALIISQDIGDRRGELNQISGIGTNYALIGDTDQAINYYNQALVISRKIGDRRSEGNIVGNIGNQYMSLGKFEKAVDHYEQGIAILREVGDRFGQVKHQGGLGVALSKANRPLDAIEALRQAQRIADDLDLHSLKGSLLVDGLETRAMLDSEDASAYAEGNWDFISTHASAFTRARAQVLRARLRATHGDPEGAVEDAEAALALYRPNGVDSHWSREAEAIVKEHAPNE